MGAEKNRMYIVELLMDNEIGIGKLYRAYAKHFPDHRTFWTALAGEEVEHASWLGKLSLKIEEGSVLIDERRFNTSAIKTFSDYLERELDKVNKSGISLIGALSTALYIEQSIIEQKYFEVFEGDTVEFKKVLLDLADATKTHLGKVKEALSKVRDV
ncbi:MAG: hypothetical protein PHI12_02365 [Dehalococcoidales bacterium]|nr:hypothetical protein [Dehalococcoidales bacterium]